MLTTSKWQGLFREERSEGQICSSCKICISTIHGGQAASAAKRLYASTLELQYSACVSPYKCLLHIFMLYGYLSLAALAKLQADEQEHHMRRRLDPSWHKTTKPSDLRPTK